jgi:Fis family transcriptional regulator
MSASTNGLLRDCVHRAIEDFFAHLDGHPCQGLYAMVLAEVEAPLLESVMTHAQGNQRVAAEFLGISRGTLRKKLRDYSLV